MAEVAAVRNGLVSSVRFEEKGAHVQVTVFVGGVNAGTLTVSPEEAGPLQRMLCGHVGVAELDLHMYRAMATNWLDMDELVCSETGFYGRLVLKLLDAIDSVRGADNAELQQTLERALVPAPADAHWLVKDFNALYRAAQAAVSSVDNAKLRSDAIGFLSARLEHLRPAFDMTESARRTASGRVAPGGWGPNDVPPKAR